MAKRALKKANPYPREPRKLNEISWFYEEPEGLVVVMECRDGDEVGGIYRGTTQATVPWRAIIAAVETHNRVKSR